MHMIIAIGQRIGQNRLFGLPHPVERFADRLYMDLSPADKTAQVKHDRRDPFIACRAIDRADQVARLQLGHGGLARE